MSLSEGKVENKILLWTLMDSREAWIYCIVMFVAFWITLAIASYFTSRYGGDTTGFFYVLAGFFLGASEVMYWVQRGLKNKANTSLSIQGRAE
jgi:hypothetical protein